MEFVKDFVAERVRDTLANTLRVCLMEDVYDLEIDARADGDRVCETDLLCDLEPEGVKAIVLETAAETLGDFETDMLGLATRVIDTDILVELDREGETDTLATELRETLVLYELDGVMLVVKIEDV